MSDNDGGFILPDVIETDDRLCVSLEIPDRPEYRAAFLGAVYELQYWFNWQRTGDDSGSRAAHLWRNILIETLEIGGCRGKNLFGGAGSGIAWPNCVRGIDSNGDGVVDCIEIHECECEDTNMVNINIYDGGCGCGCGGNGMGRGINGGNDGLYAPPMNPGTGGLPGDTPTYCDVIASWVPKVAAAASEFFLTFETLVQTFGEAGIDKIVDGLIGDFPFVGNAGAVFVDWVTDVLEFGAGNVRLMFNDQDFIESMQVAYVKAFGDVTYVESMTRENFRQWNRYIPQAFYIAPQVIILPRVVFRLFTEFSDLSGLNTRLRTARGNGDPALCEFIYELAGVAQPLANTPNTDTGGAVGTSLCGFYDFTQGPQNWAVMADDSLGNGDSYGETFYSPGQMGWARGFVDVDSSLGIRAYAVQDDIVNITQITVVGFETNEQGAGGPGVYLYKNGSLVDQKGSQWPAYGNTPQTVTFNYAGIDADEIRVVNGTLRNNDILVIQSVEIVCT